MSSDGDRVVAADTLRFMTRNEIAAFLKAARFDRVTWRGDWEGSPFRPDSPEIIAIADTRSSP